MKFNRTQAHHFIIGLACLLITSRAAADATVYWSLDYNGFQPATVVIAPGEKVTWYNVDIYNLDTHVYFDNGFNFSLPNYSGMTVTFNVGAGVYGYQDNIGDTASVVVNVAPTVAITAPANNAVFAAPATFIVQATASDTADDYISGVAFYLGTSDSTNLIEDVYSAPFTTGLTNLDAGSYTLLAVATDSRGWTSTDAITINVGTVPAIQMNSPRVADGKFFFDIAGLTSGKTNIIRVSTNLVSWLPIKTNIATSTTMTITNNATVAKQFYRIYQLP